MRSAIAFCSSIGNFCRRSMGCRNCSVIEVPPFSSVLLRKYTITAVFYTLHATKTNHLSWLLGFSFLLSSIQRGGPPMETGVSVNKRRVSLQPPAAFHLDLFQLVKRNKGAMGERLIAQWP